MLGEGLHESLTRTMGNYLAATGGLLSNKNKSPWEKAIAARMSCTNNSAEGPFATVRAFLQMYPSLKLRTVASLSAAIVNGTHRPAHKVLLHPLPLYSEVDFLSLSFYPRFKVGNRMVAAGMAVAGSPELKSAVTILCCVRTKSQGKVTIFLRENNIRDAVGAAVLRKKLMAKKMQKKARSHANKMADFDVAAETILAETVGALADEVASFGQAKIAVRTYLQEQYKSRRLLRNGNYKTIPYDSEYRQKVKPYALRMNPFPSDGGKVTTDMQITYLTKLLHLMIAEDSQRPLATTAGPEDQNLVRRLPVLSEHHLNPESVRLKLLQESTVAAMAAPKDNPWFARLHEEYMGKILYDGGYYRVFMIQFVPNKG